MHIYTIVLAVMAVLLFIMTAYKYFFYSADCNPRNKMSLEVNSLLDFIGQASDFCVWLIPIVWFFWPNPQSK